MRVSTTDQLIRGVTALGPSIPQDAWREAEANDCAVIKAVRVVQMQLTLPDDVEIERPSSPIIDVDEAAEIFAKIAPNSTDKGILRPLLHRVIFENDKGNQKGAITALWLLFNSIEEFDELRLKPGQEEPVPHPSGQAAVGSKLLYITNNPYHKPMQIDSCFFDSPAEEDMQAVVQARKEDPAPWTDAHQQWPSDSCVAFT